MFICIKADYAKRIQSAISHEETWYYLNGFNVAPNSDGKGVTIVATDGHVLSAFYDADGVTYGDSNHCIVRLSKDELKHCKTAKAGDPWLVIEGDFKSTSLTIAFGSNADEAIEFAKDRNAISPCRTLGQHFIDGTFPDWRRVLPDVTKLTGGLVASVAGAKVQQLAACVASVKGFSVLRFYGATDNGFPVLVLSGSHSDWLGVLMPVRDTTSPANAALPAWVNAIPAQSAAA